MNKPSEKELKQLLILNQKFHLPVVSIHKLAREAALLLTPKPKLLDLLELFKKLDELGSPEQAALEISTRFPCFRLKGETTGNTSKQVSTKIGNPYFYRLANALGKDVNVAEAEDFFEDVIRIIPVAKRCKREMILRAVKYCQATDGKVTIDTLETELRKRCYGYKQDPDSIRIIYTSMGGKKDR